ncbi:hypothetical protein [Sphingomonas sp. BK235]|uniref:hypothetical protein n=1 Tax=Sphingomonas sp. BK235 TaxID=2512131 RepID=UPI0010492BD3|nr:hypothetical protein [Sphingomonas sp. BK235]TCP35070.1 hypothetical protein EV292_103501 [Sphingomonas sp. BK235]
MHRYAQLQPVQLRMSSSIIARRRNDRHVLPRRSYPAIGDYLMRMFETAASTALAIAAQALVVGVVLTTL